MQRISVVPDPARLGDIITVCFNAGGIIPTPDSVDVTISDGMGNSKVLTIPIDSGTHGGCADLHLKPSEWDQDAGGLEFTNPWSDAQTIVLD